MKKLFIFAYPQEIFFLYPDPWSTKQIANLNDAIRIRYRENGWNVGFVTYNNWGVDKRVEVHARDLIIRDGQNVYQDVREGVIRRYSDGKPAYTPAKRVVVQFPNVKELRVGGFHSGSCVEMLAREAYRQGINTMADEELGNMFALMRPEDKFNPREFPGFNRLRYFQDDDFMMKFFNDKRKNKPWLYDWRKYQRPAA